MKKVAYSVAMLAVVAAAFVAGAWYSHRAASNAGARKVLYYVDPMHPAYKSDKPGIAPDCGMQLEPVYADGGPAAGADASLAAAPPGTVQIAPDKQQLIGVRLGTAEKTGSAQSLRLFGRVSPDETKVFSINAGVGGSIRDLAPVTVGSRVKKDQVLGSFYGPDALAALQLFVANVSGHTRIKLAAKTLPNGQLESEGDDGEHETALSANLRLRVMQLENLGVSALQREEILETRRVPDFIKIVSPADGIVLARNVNPGQKFERSAELFKVADLRRVWILADVYENDARYVRPGIVAQLSLPGQKATLTARVTEVLPQFDAATRTMKVRLEADNPGLVLRPDMFVDVAFPVNLAAATVVPVDAVVDTGLKRTVFVDRGNGYFEPRAIETGWRFGDKVEVVKGLEAGERIVVSGTFLVDSESRLKAAAAGVYGEASKDPVCGMDVDQARARAAGKTIQRDGKTHFFCSEDCKHKFEAEPAKYLAAAAPAHDHAHAAAEPAQAAAGGTVDPMCGMKVDEAKAGAAGRKSEVGGRAYYFCSDQCKKEFDKDPQATLAKTGARAAR